MPPVKNEKSSTTPLNTSAQIQQIFSEVQSQLPSVNFDNDDQNDDDDDSNDEDILQTNLAENTDALLDSLANNTNPSFLTLHPRIETPQQPPSVELQMRVSPNLFDSSTSHQDSPPRPSVLSMDLFNSIDFDRLPSLASNPNLHPCSNLTRTFNRPPPINHRAPSLQQSTNLKTRDDRQLLDRLAQQANQFSRNERTHATRENLPFRNLESALFSTSHEQFDRHGKRLGPSESERKTIYIDLRNSHKPNQEQSEDNHASRNINHTTMATQPQVSESESDDDEESNDGMLWFEKRQQAKRQQQQSKTSPD